MQVSADGSDIVADRIDDGTSPHQLVDDVDRAVARRQVEGSKSILRRANVPIRSTVSRPRLGGLAPTTVSDTNVVEVIDTCLRVVKLEQFSPLLTGCQLEEVRIVLTGTASGFSRLVHCMLHPHRHCAELRDATHSVMRAVFALLLLNISEDFLCMNRGQCD